MLKLGKIEILKISKSRCLGKSLALTESTRARIFGMFTEYQQIPDIHPVQAWR